MSDLVEQVSRAIADAIDEGYDDTEVFAIRVIPIIRAATIEECARVAESTWDHDRPVAAIAAAIRALKEQK